MRIIAGDVLAANELVIPRIPSRPTLPTASLSESKELSGLRKGRGGSPYCPAHSGAGTRTRTADLRFTKPLLYQLSYTGMSFRTERIIGFCTAAGK